MPEYFRENINNKIQISVWKVKETENELVNGLELSQGALERLYQRKSQVHRKGFLAVRQILKSFDVDPLIHQYNENGAPFLTDGRHLSISHTKDTAAVAISLDPVGIDLEHYKEKIKKIAPRFLHKNEIKDSEKSHDIKYLTQIWTAKEALYKVHCKPGIHFRTDLYVKPFKSNAHFGLGSINQNGKTYIYNVYFRFFENFCLSLATLKNN